MEEERNAFQADADIAKLLDDFELYPNIGLIFPKPEDVNESEIWTVTRVIEELPEGVGARFLLKSGEANLELDFSAGYSTMRWDARIPEALEYGKPVKNFLDKTQKLLFFELPARIDPMIRVDEKAEIERMRRNATKIDLITKDNFMSHEALSENENYMQFIVDFCAPGKSYEYMVAHIAPFEGGRPLYTLTVKYPDDGEIYGRMQIKLASTPRYNPWRRDVSSWVLSSEKSEITDGMRGVMAVGFQKTIETIWKEELS